jgi:hypothetical protein
MVESFPFGNDSMALTLGFKPTINQGVSSMPLSFDMHGS